MSSDPVPDPSPLPQLLPPTPDDTAPAPAIADGPSVDLLDMVLAGLADQSRAGYTKDLATLAAFLGVAGPAAAVGQLLRLDRGQVNALAAAWTSAMLEAGLSPATVRRRYAALARVFRAGRRFGLTEVAPEAELPRTEALRDTTGPGRRGWARLLDVAETEAVTGRPGAVRNLALVLLAHDRGLRRGELAGLDWPDDFDPARPGVRVLGKGRREKEWLTASARAAAAVTAWLAVRGDWPGPLFVRCDRASKAPERLDGHGVNDAVKALAGRAGLSRTVRAHGLRHQAITEALDAGWSIRDVMQFSRHANPKTVMAYDDRRRDVGGEIARSLGHERRPPRRKP
jgi:integrase/recombinase XerC